MCVPAKMELVAAPQINSHSVVIALLTRVKCPEFPRRPPDDTHLIPQQQQCVIAAIRYRLCSRTRRCRRHSPLKAEIPPPILRRARIFRKIIRGRPRVHHPLPKTALRSRCVQNLTLGEKSAGFPCVRTTCNGKEMTARYSPGFGFAEFNLLPESGKSGGLISF